MKCDKCKWANWNRTKNGRLHPDKSGKCTYKIVIPQLPEAFFWDSFYSKRIPSANGGWIERGIELKDNCVYYEES